jgi:hypothetical protein
VDTGTPSADYIHSNPGCTGGSAYRGPNTENYDKRECEATKESPKRPLPPTARRGTEPDLAGIARRARHAIKLQEFAVQRLLTTRNEMGTRSGY